MHKESVTQLSQRQRIELKKDRRTYHLPWQKNSVMGPVPEMPRSKSKRQTLEGSQHDEMKEK